MVLLGHRNAEYGREAIAGDVLERTPITLDLLASKSVQRSHLVMQGIETQAPGQPWSIA
jgi:hypothetical protein